MPPRPLRSACVPTIDIVVNNAGIESSSPFLEIDLAHFERVMRVNTTGVWLCCQAVMPVMQRQGQGIVVNISSVAGQRGGGFLGTSAYATSKGAVIALTKALAREFAKSGIRVNAVAPALTMTDLVQRQLDRAAPGTQDRIIDLNRMVQAQARWPQPPAARVAHRSCQVPADGGRHPSLRKGLMFYTVHLRFRRARCAAPNTATSTSPRLTAGRAG